ncbi:DEAD/DEAH box helicase [Corynebacterium endometrii]|uniref:ATP-dependent RNA helicase SrmB n=1 Tax=Corynebacterium endometrii TaxID=2488819 RepID=A0A4P7QF98_9CORY|nr:DEAD/DEAH box helicase [Corynebacterium endometrii]QCB28203.1 ATP-dependent RNA helicase SrmB [Corynebacterium endometrii]
MSLQDWQSPSDELMAAVDDYRERCVQVYSTDRNRIEEDFRKERSIAEGGYGRKQIQELIQNAADALQTAPGRLEVHLTEDALYVANQGKPFQKEGVRALLYAHLSAKTGEEIGRFGLGFKSMCGISEAPQIFSQTVSFEFNRDKTKEELSNDLGSSTDVLDVPVLRLAWLLDPQAEFDRDPLLRKLANWAVTIIKIPLLTGASTALEEEIREFDESFCLFAPAVKSLKMTSEISQITRKFKAKRAGKKVTLEDANGKESHWLVFSKSHIPSDKALESAGQAARRNKVTVSWAVPTHGKVGVGQLSAFFPVQSEVTLSGKINAPFKLSDDRINVIEGEFNREILEMVVPELVVEARQSLAEIDFGRYLDILPARGRESRSWADEVINEPIYEALRGTRCLPNGDGELRSPSTLKLTPELVPTSLTPDWLEKAVQKDEWIHPSCTSNSERTSKAKRLLGESKYGKLSQWLSCYIHPKKKLPQESINALSAAHEVLLNTEPENVRSTETEIRQAAIVLLETGIWQYPVRGQCFVRSNEKDRGPAFIDARVVENDRALRALNALDIDAYAESGQLTELLADIRHTTRINWDRAWSILRSSDIEDVRRGFREDLLGKHRLLIKVRNLRGQWVLPDGHYLPGALLEPLAADADYLVDNRYHGADAEILRELGIQSHPFRNFDHFNEKWFKKYKKANREGIGIQLGLKRHQWDGIAYGEDTPIHGPLNHFAEMSDTNRAHITKYLLTYSNTPTIRAKHPQTKTSVKALHPEYWLLRRHGIIESSMGLVGLANSFALNDESTEVEDIVPVISGLSLTENAAKQLGIKTAMDQLQAEDFKEMAAFHRQKENEGLLGKTYAWWAFVEPETPPAQVHVRVGENWEYLPPEEVAISADQELETILEDLGIPTLPVVSAEDVNQMAEAWGFMPSHRVPREFDYEPVLDSIPLATMFPTLWMHLEQDIDLDSIEVQACKSLVIASAVPGRPRTTKVVDRGREGNLILTTSETLRGQLEHVFLCLDQSFDDYTLNRIIEDIEKQKNQKLRAQLRAAASDAERISLLFADEYLMTLIPAQVFKMMEESSERIPSGIELAELCTKMYGPSTLEKLASKSTLPDSIGQPPKRWHGTYAARKWVKELGFSERWAGFKSVAPASPSEFVEGPAKPPQFHDYQQLVSDKLREMIRGTEKKRGLITLPTGAGKTRVAVQSIVESITAGEFDSEDGTPFDGTLLWIVSNEELCEQAIDVWAYIWRGLGRQGTPLTLSRHFGQRYNAEEEVSGVQVVVSTYQKMGRTIGNPDYEWLRETPLVIIDEAHSALAPTYTKILEWTGRAAHQRDKLLLGLTATPFRGRSDSPETQRLLKRFDENILDKGVFGDEEPLARLQRDLVLSHVEMEHIDTNSFVKLTPEEVEAFRERHWLPRHSEIELGSDIDRTNRIVASILEKPSDWSIIVFAASVENAETIATLLTMQGCPAAAISENTSIGERRLAVERFKNGELRVLTNYAVLSQGFDFPGTNAVYITRPTQSEVRYQQMIGRGLRGPKNGGTKKCHIVNVLDNIEQFDLSINYEQFEKLTDSSRSLFGKQGEL